MSNTTDPTFNASAHTIINLVDLYQPHKPQMNFEDMVPLPKNYISINQLSKEFRTRGWAIVRFPKDISAAKLIAEFPREMFGHKGDYSKLAGSAKDAEPFYTFFAQNQAEKEKCLGYSEVPHKESIHIETPNYYLKDKMPAAIRTPLENWYRIYDEITIDLVDILSQPIFGCDKATLAARADLPIAFGGHAGMIDVAYYKNQQVATISPAVGHSTKDVNCVPHYDPGFLSISFLSTHDGLQLQDPSTGTWYAGPVNTVPGQEDLGVIWLGDAAVKASKGALRPGVHRVVYPQTAKPRIAVWYELCTVDQLNQDRLAAIPKKGEVTLPNLPGSKPVNMDGDVRLFERYYGIPMSKVMRRSDSFSVAYSADTKSKNPDLLWG